MRVPPIRLVATWHTAAGHKHRIIYSPGEESQVIGLIGVWACRPDLDFNWGDAAGMQNLVLRLSEQVGAGPHEATPAM